MKRSKLMYMLASVGLMSLSAHADIIEEYEYEEIIPEDSYQIMDNTPAIQDEATKRWYFSNNIGFATLLNEGYDDTTWSAEIKKLTKIRTDTIKDFTKKLNLKPSTSTSLQSIKSLNGISVSAILGYKTDNWGRLEVEGILDVMNEPKGEMLFHQQGKTIMGNWYYDLISSSTFDVFLGGGLGYSYRSLNIMSEILPSVNNWAAQARGGIRLNTSPTSGIAFSYGMFMLPTKSTLVFSNSILNTIGEKVQNLLDLPENTMPLVGANSATYRNHGIRIDTFFKF